jgi:hypothetical protein
MPVSSGVFMEWQTSSSTGVGLDNVFVRLGFGAVMGIYRILDILR